MNLVGKVSWFGGPDDMGVAPDEGLAFVYEVDDAPHLFLSTQPPDTTGLARRLDADDVFYIATRWDYNDTPKSSLIDMKVLVRAVKTGKAFIAHPADWGPHEDTNRIADISPALMTALGIETDDEVEVTFPYEEDVPMSDIPVCIDISHHQGYPDFDEVKAAGVLGIIHKATEGTTFVDSARATNCSNALKCGLAISTYFWLKPGDGRAQAEFYLRTIDPQPGERVCIDYEEDGCSLTTLYDAVQALLDYGNDLKITVYSGHLLKEKLGGGRDDFLAENTDLWLAQYTSDESNISWPDETYEQWTLWQYSESGSVDGIDGSYVDYDTFNGNADAFLEWISPTGKTPEPPTPLPPPSEVVNVAITAPKDVDVKVTVNGAAIQTKRHRLRRILREARRGPDVLR